MPSEEPRRVLSEEPQAPSRRTSQRGAAASGAVRSWWWLPLIGACIALVAEAIIWLTTAPPTGRITSLPARSGVLLIGLLFAAVPYIATRTLGASAAPLNLGGDERRYRALDAAGRAAVDRVATRFLASVSFTIVMLAALVQVAVTLVAHGRRDAVVLVVLFVPLLVIPLPLAVFSVQQAIAEQERTPQT
ncbi:MAG: hypothetical protein MUE41_07450 [Gemmatimonadaceae bacterium]|nr:hypothetical protein [Gemmatimonadaceae bacterium]